jgi:hypothetical protein
MLILAPWLVRSIAHVSKVPFASGDVNRGGTEKPHCVVLVTSETYDVSAALRGTQSEPGPARLDVTPRDTHIRKHEPRSMSEWRVSDIVWERHVRLHVVSVERPKGITFAAGQILGPGCEAGYPAHVGWQSRTYVTASLAKGLVAFA